VGVDREKERGKVGFCFTAALRRDVEGGGEVLRSLAAGRRGGGRDAVADGTAAARGGGVLDGRGAGQRDHGGPGAGAGLPGRHPRRRLRRTRRGGRIPVPPIPTLPPCPTCV